MDRPPLLAGFIFLRRSDPVTVVVILAINYRRSLQYLMAIERFFVEGFGQSTVIGESSYVRRRPCFASVDDLPPELARSDGPRLIIPRKRLTIRHVLWN